MTTEQHERWNDFSTRMAIACFAAHRRPTGTWILDRVNEFITNIWNVPAITDWDNSTEDEHCAGDLMAIYQDEFEPYWDFEERIDWNKPGGDDRLWRIQQAASEQWGDQFFGPIRCCVRAGLDIASSPSAGVLGFNVGDIRKIYPSGIPDWVAEFWTGGDIRTEPATAAIWL